MTTVYRPGRNLLRGAVALALLAAAPVLWWPLRAAAPLVLLVLAVAVARDVAVLRRTLGGVAVRRRMPSIVGRGVEFRVELELACGDAMPVSSVAGSLRDVAPGGAQPGICIVPLQLRPGAMHTAGYSLRFPRRGKYTLGPVWIGLAAPFGMVEAQREFACAGEVRVFPEQIAGSDGLRKDVLSEKVLIDRAQETRQRGVGTEFESLSEYRAGDDPRRIDWHSSARYRKLVVRRFQVERHRDVMLVLDCGRTMGAAAGAGTKLDHAVNAALLLGWVALHWGDRCGIGVFDDRMRGYLPPTTGPRAFPVLTSQLYDLQSQLREPDFSEMFATLQRRQSKRCLVVVFSDAGDSDTSGRYFAALAQLSRRHKVLFVALRTPLLDETAGQQDIGTEIDAARKVVALRLLREREKSLHLLRRSGVTVLDTEPDKISVPLINHYTALHSGTVM